MSTSERKIEFIDSEESPVGAPKGELEAELYDAEGRRRDPFEVKPLNDSGEVVFDLNEAEVQDFYGETVEDYYIRIVYDYPIELANGESTEIPLTLANTKEDGGSWNNQNYYTDGIVEFDFGGDDELIEDVPVTGRYYIFSTDEVEKDFYRIIDVEHTSDPELPTVSFRDGLIITRVPTKEDGTGEDGKVQLFRRGMSGQEPIAEQNVVGNYPKTVEIDLPLDVHSAMGGNVTVYESDGSTPIPDATVELRDNENMERGPFRSEITDENGVAEVRFNYSDLIEFFGRFVDRFSIQVWKDDRKIVDTTTDEFGSDAEMPMFDDEGIWSLAADDTSPDSDIVLPTSGHHVTIEVVDEDSKTPKYPAWIEIYPYINDPSRVVPLDIVKLDSEDGTATFRRSTLDDETAYRFRLVTEDSEPVDLHPVDAPKEPFLDEDGYTPGWVPDFPAPSHQLLVFRVDRRRTLEVSGQIIDSELEEGLANVRVSLFGNASDQGVSGTEADSYIATEDGTVQKISSKGIVRWEYERPEYDGSDPVNDVTVDPDGMVYFVATTGDSGESTNVKLYPNGSHAWAAGFGKFTHIRSDHSTNYLFTVADGDPDTLWEIVDGGDDFGGTNWSKEPHPTVHGLAVDNERHVYTVGDDEAVKKHDADADGDEVWTFNGHTDEVVDVAVDGGGYVYTASKDNTVKILDGTLDPSDDDFVVASISQSDWEEVFTLGVGKNGLFYVGVEASEGGEITVSRLEQYHFEGEDPVQNWTRGLDLQVDVTVGGRGFVYGTDGGDALKLSPSSTIVWSETEYDNVKAIAADPGPYGALPEAHEELEGLASDAASASTVTDSRGRFSISVPEYALQLNREARNSSVLRLESNQDEVVPVRAKGTSDFYEHLWEFGFDEESLNFDLEVDLENVDGLDTYETNEYRLVGQLIDTSGDEDVPRGGLRVRMIEKDEDSWPDSYGNVWVDTYANQEGYFGVRWEEPAEGPSDKERDFEFEISSPDGYVDVTVIQSVDPDPDDDEVAEFTIETDLSPDDAEEIDIVEASDIASTTPFDYVKTKVEEDDDYDKEDAFDLAVEYRQAVVEKKLTDLFAHEIRGEMASGFILSSEEEGEDLDLDHEESCTCQRCVSIFGRLAYLSDLIRYAQQRVTLDGIESPDVGDWSDFLGQPIEDFPADCDVLDQPVSTARIGAEVLQHQALEEGADEDDLLEEAEDYRIAAYAELLSAHGVAPNRLVEVPPASDNGSTDSTAARYRQTAASRLGVDEEDLDEFVLDPHADLDDENGISEKTLEELFGFRATLDDSDPADPTVPGRFEDIGTPTLLEKQRDHLEARWFDEDHPEDEENGEDGNGADPFDWDYPIIEPDLVGIAEVKPDTAAETILENRRQMVADRREDLEDLEANLDGDPTDEELFNELLAAAYELGLDGSDYYENEEYENDGWEGSDGEAWDEDLQPIVNQRQNEAPFQEDLAEYYLTVPALNFLANLKARINEDIDVTDHEWEQMVAHLLAGIKRSHYSEWRDEEVDDNDETDTGSVSLTPRQFQLLEEVEEGQVFLEDPPESHVPRIDWERRRKWERTLESRVSSWDDLEENIEEALQDAERDALPVLRHALIEHVAEGEAETHEQRAEWCTDEFFVDMRLDGSVRRTRPQQAVNSIKTVLYGARMELLDTTDVEVELDTYDFDDIWEWLGDYRSWKTAISVLTYPENFLGTVPRTRRTELFEKFRSDVDRRRSLTPAMACEVANEHADRVNRRSEIEILASCRLKMPRQISSTCGSVTFTDDQCFVMIARENLPEGKERLVISTLRLDDNYRSEWKELELPHDEVTAVLGIEHPKPSWPVAINYEFKSSDEGSARAVSLHTRKNLEKYDKLDYELDFTYPGAGAPVAARNVQTGVKGMFMAGSLTSWVEVRPVTDPEPYWTDSIIVEVLPEMLHIQWRERSVKDIQLALDEYFNDNHPIAVHDDLSETERSGSLVQAAFRTSGNTWLVLHWGSVGANSSFGPICLVRTGDGRPDEEDIAYLGMVEEVIGVSVGESEVLIVTQDSGSSLQWNDCYVLNRDSDGNLEPLSTGEGISPIGVTGRAAPSDDDLRIRNIVPRNDSLGLEVNEPHRCVIECDVARSDGSFERVHAMGTFDYDAGEESVELADVVYLTPRFNHLEMEAPQQLGEEQITDRRLLLPDLLHELDTNATKQVRWMAEEMFFFVPLVLARQLREDGHYRAAADWLRTIYDYSAPKGERYIFPVDEEGIGLQSEQEYEEWLKDPLDPHSIARMRDGVYRKYLLFEVCQTLLTAADEKFKENTESTRARARELYREALEILDEAQLSVSRPEKCDLDGFEEEVWDALTVDEPDSDDAILHTMDRIGVEELIRILGQISEPSDRDDAAEAVITEIEQTDGSKKEKLQAGFVEARSQVPEDSPPPFADLLQDDETETDGVTEAVSQQPLIEQRAEYLKDRAKSNVEQGLQQVFGQELQEINDDALYDFLSDPLASEVPQDLSDEYQNEEYGVTAEASFQIVDGEEGQIYREFLPSPHFAFCASPNPLFDILSTQAEGKLAKLRNDLTFHGNPNPARPQRDLADESAQVALTGNIAQLETVGSSPQHFSTQYRFDVLLQIARRFVQTAAQLEDNYLQVLQRHDEEGFRLLDADQAIEHASAREDVDRLRVARAESEQDVLKEQHEKARQRQVYYNEQLGYGKGEFARDTGRALMSGLSTGISGATVGAKFGSAGGPVGAVIGAAVGVGTSVVSSFRSQSDEEEKWAHKRDQAQQQQEVNEQRQQVQRIVRRITEAERRITQLELEHAEETLRYLEDEQFTTRDFYWVLRNIYRRAYEAVLDYATEMAQLAQHQLNFERRESISNPIGQNYFVQYETGPGGEEVETAGIGGPARLRQDLTQLEQEAVDTKERRLNVNKTFSMRRESPTELNELRRNGRLHFHPTLEDFDQEFPGQYHRRIEDVKITVVALTPPPSGLRASLFTDGVSYLRDEPTIDDKQLIQREHQRMDFTVSTGAEAVFDMDPQAELLRPFEGLGVETEFILEMPRPSNRWDLSTIQDVLITVEYTAEYDADKEARTIDKLGTTRSEQQNLSLRNQFSDEWFTLINADLDEELPDFVYEIDRDHFRPNLSDLRTSTARLIIVTSEMLGEDASEGTAEEIDVKVEYGDTGYDEAVAIEGMASSVRGDWGDIEGDSPVSTWRFRFFDPEEDGEENPVKDLIEADELVDIILSIEYEGEAPAWPSSS